LQPIKAEKVNIQHLEGIKIWSLDISLKMFLTKNSVKSGYMDLAFVADKGPKGRSLVLNLQNTQKKSKFGVSGISA